MIRRSCVAALVPVVLLLSACAAPTPVPTAASSNPVVQTPSATPISTPTAEAEPAGPPALSQLVLTADGLGPLQIGSPIDPELATFEPEGCRTPDIYDYWPDGAREWEAWIPNYPQEPDQYGVLRYPFEPHHDDSGNLAWLRVESGDIATDTGIRIGASTRADVEAAYPDAEVYEEWGATAFGIAGSTGRLVIEVLKEDAGGAIAVDHVWTMRLDPLDYPLTALAFGDAGGWCSVA